MSCCKKGYVGYITFSDSILNDPILAHYFKSGGGNTQVENTTVYDMKSSGKHAAKAGIGYRGNNLSDASAATIEYPLDSTSDLNAFGLRVYVNNTISDGSPRSGILSFNASKIDGFVFGNATSGISNEILTLMQLAGGGRVAWSSASETLDIGYHDILVYWDGAEYVIEVDGVIKSNDSEGIMGKMNLNLVRLFSSPVYTTRSPSELSIIEIVVFEDELTLNDKTAFYANDLANADNAILFRTTCETNSTKFDVAENDIVGVKTNFTTSEVLTDFNERRTTTLNIKGWLVANGTTHYADDSQTQLFDAGDIIPAYNATHAMAFDENGDRVELTVLGKAAHNGVASVDKGLGYKAGWDSSFNVTWDSPEMYKVLVEELGLTMTPTYAQMKLEAQTFVEYTDSGTAITNLKAFKTDQS